MAFSRDERAALCQLLAEVGPDAPTLCEGWTTRDLAAHMVARERRPDSGPGLVLSSLAGWTERVRRGELAKPYEELVAELRGGPPRWSVFGLPATDALLNTVEFFVHHEDVRRAQPGWEPRELSPAFEEDLWRRLRPSAPRLLRRVRVGIQLHRPDGLTAQARAGSPRVDLVGPASE